MTASLFADVSLGMPPIAAAMLELLLGRDAEDGAR
jgi:hypothetical protein